MLLYSRPCQSVLNIRKMNLMNYSFKVKNNDADGHSYN